MLTISKISAGSSNQSQTERLSPEQMKMISPSENLKLIHTLVAGAFLLNAVHKMLPTMDTSYRTLNGKIVEKIVIPSFRPAAELRKAWIVAAISIAALVVHLIHHYRQNPRDNLIKLCQKHLRDNEATAFATSDTIGIQTSYDTTLWVKRLQDAPIFSLRMYLRTMLP